MASYAFGIDNIALGSAAYQKAIAILAASLLPLMVVFLFSGRIMEIFLEKTLATESGKFTL
jgi:hypothetical protein